jgi:type IX secretion system PorP/SprF family membrane protein
MLNLLNKTAPTLYMKSISLFFLSLLAIGVSATRAQEGIPVYFDYLTDNYYLVHPSMAGIGEGGKVRLTARQQWFSVDEAPNLQTLSVHYRVPDTRSGVGAIVFNDANGYHSQTGMKLTYAHHLPFSSDYRALNQLSFGFSAGFIQSSLDETEFRSVIADPIITGGRNSVGYFNADLGMSYNYLEFYAHVSVLNLLGSGRDLYTAIEFDNLRRYLFSAGYVFGKGQWQFEPSFLLQMTEFTRERTLDLNAKVYRDVGFGTVFGGVSYRRSFDGAQFLANGTFGEQRLQLFTPLLGIQAGNFLFAYNYSYQSGDIRLDNGGFHQITLGYDFGQLTAKRYDCKCPAVNY